MKRTHVSRLQKSWGNTQITDFSSEKPTQKFVRIEESVTTPRVYIGADNAVDAWWERDRTATNQNMRCLREARAIKSHGVAEHGYLFEDGRKPILINNPFIHMENPELFLRNLKPDNTIIDYKDVIHQRLNAFHNRTWRKSRVIAPNDDNDGLEDNSQKIGSEPRVRHKEKCGTNVYKHVDELHLTNPHDTGYPTYGNQIQTRR
jgi:hypothetical protein